jgi:hypothetical protein
MHSVADMPPYEVYSRVASQFTKNLFTAILGTVFAYWLAGVWPLGAQALFWSFVVVTGLSGLQVLATTGVGVVASRMAKGTGEVVADAVWLRRATYVRVAEFGAACVLLYVLYRRIW